MVTKIARVQYLFHNLTRKQKVYYEASDALLRMMRILAARDDAYLPTFIHLWNDTMTRQIMFYSEAKADVKVFCRNASSVTEQQIILPDRYLIEPECCVIF